MLKIANKKQSFDHVKFDYLDLQVCSSREIIVYLGVAIKKMHLADVPASEIDLLILAMFMLH